MFASRANQENAIYEQQTAAAAKPLNQGVKGLAPKTPGNKAPKTPFKVPLNDENAKTGGKGKQKGLFGDGKAGKADMSAFVTPAGPRTRAPLGNKTTNAKATAFQTPGPPTQEKQSAKGSSPRMRRAKIQVRDAEPVATTNEQEEPEIEYMAPREVPLPDHPDDWPHDRTYPQFEGDNLTRGWFSEFSKQVDYDDDEEFSDFEEKLKRVKELEKKKQQAKKASPVKKQGFQKATRDPLTTKPPQSLEARSAAAALSNSTKSAATARVAAPTATSKARLPSAVISKKPANVFSTTGNPRHTAAKVASNSTLGYTKGRAVSGFARKPSPTTHGNPKSSGEDGKALPAKPAASLDELFGFQNLNVDDDSLGGSAEENLGELDDEDQVFQLESVDL